MSGDPFDYDMPATTPVGYYDGGQTPSGQDMANGYGLYDMPGNLRLVGENSSGTITNCYTNCSVSGEFWSVGGLVGENSSGEVTDSFWDTQTSGQVISEGGTGKTTAEMRMAGTFLETGWDFMDETENGTEDIWWILVGQGYPRLWWEAE